MYTHIDDDTDKDMKVSLEYEQTCKFIKGGINSELIMLSCVANFSTRRGKALLNHKDLVSAVLNLKDLSLCGHSGVTYLMNGKMKYHSCTPSSSTILPKFQLCVHLVQSFLG